MNCYFFDFIGWMYWLCQVEYVDFIGWMYWYHYGMDVAIFFIVLRFLAVFWLTNTFMDIVLRFFGYVLVDFAYLLGYWYHYEFFVSDFLAMFWLIVAIFWLTDAIVVLYSDLMAMFWLTVAFVTVLLCWWTFWPCYGRIPLWYDCDNMSRFCIYGWQYY